MIDVFFLIFLCRRLMKSGDDASGNNKRKVLLSTLSFNPTYKNNHHDGTNQSLVSP